MREGRQANANTANSHTFASAQEIAKAKKGDDQARERILTSLRQTITGTARRMVPKARGVLEFDDLVSIGMLAVLKAITGFDASRGTRFHYYAATKIQFEMRKAIDRYSGKLETVPLEDDELSEEGDFREQVVDKYYWKAAMRECLSPVETKVVRMVIWDELSFREIEEQTHYSHTKVASIYHGAIEKLKRYAEGKQGFEEDANAGVSILK